MSSGPEYSPSSDVEPGRRRRQRVPRRERHARRTIAVGFMQLVSLVGIVGLAVILGAVMAGNVSGWIDGLVIGAGSVILTMLVLFSGHHARRH